MGFEAAIFRRVNFVELAKRKVERLLEFQWQGSQALGKSANIFGHLLDSTYSSPIGFDFEHGGGPVTSENVQAKAQLLMEQMNERSQWFRTNHILVPLGGDFEYQNATVMFSNMSIVMDYVNAREDTYGAKLFYSTLPEYFEAVFAQNVTFPNFGGDFLPYISFFDSWWTGFYTSRFAHFQYN